MQGANFDGENLSDASSNAAELVKLDCNVMLAYVLMDEEGPYSEGSYVTTPCYFSTSREQLLVEVSPCYRGSHNSPTIPHPSPHPPPPLVALCATDLHAYKRGHV
jgi:hypothetical protein